MASQDEPKKYLRLNSPAGGEAKVYEWPLIRTPNYDESQDLVATIELVFDEVYKNNVHNITTRNNIIAKMPSSDYEEMRSMCDRFNKLVKAMHGMYMGTTLDPLCENPPSSKILNAIITKVYRASVSNPERLNCYTAFTPSVYGETKFETIEKMLECISLDENSVVIDLGSGVGQVVLQIAASARVKMVYGIEKEEIPNTYAQAMDRNFRTWMNWFGFKYSPFELIAGDFLHEEHRTKITSSKLIFVNNYVFGAEVDNALKKIFEGCEHGTAIVSSVAFGKCTNNRPNSRNVQDLGVLLDTKKVPPIIGEVSWTDKPVKYFVQFIDLVRLNAYFEDQQKRQANGNSNGNGRRKTKKVRSVDLNVPTKDTDDETSTHSLPDMSMSPQTAAASANLSFSREVSAAPPITRGRGRGRPPGSTNKRATKPGIAATRPTPALCQAALEALHSHTLLSTELRLASSPEATPGAEDFADVSEETMECTVEDDDPELKELLAELMNRMRPAVKRFCAARRNTQKFSDNILRRQEMLQKKLEILRVMRNAMAEEVKRCEKVALEHWQKKASKLNLPSSTTEDMEKMLEAYQVYSRCVIKEGSVLQLVKQECQLKEEEALRKIYSVTDFLRGRNNTALFLEIVRSVPALYNVFWGTLLKQLKRSCEVAKVHKAELLENVAQLEQRKKEAEEQKASGPRFSVPVMSLPNFTNFKENTPPVQKKNPLLPPVVPLSNPAAAAANGGSSRHGGVLPPASSIGRQDYPLVPDLGRIDEKNPTKLAHKIVEQGRIEQSLLMTKAAPPAGGGGARTNVKGGSLPLAPALDMSYPSDRVQSIITKCLNDESQSAEETLSSQVPPNLLMSVPTGNAEEAQQQQQQPPPPPPPQGAAGLDQSSLPMSVALSATTSASALSSGSPSKAFFSPAHWKSRREAGSASFPPVEPGGRAPDYSLLSPTKAALLRHKQQAGSVPGVKTLEISSQNLIDMAIDKSYNAANLYSPISRPTSAEPNLAGGGGVPGNGQMIASIFSAVDDPDPEPEGLAACLTESAQHVQKKQRIVGAEKDGTEVAVENLSTKKWDKRMRYQNMKKLETDDGVPSGGTEKPISGSERNGSHQLDPLTLADSPSQPDDEDFDQAFNRALNYGYNVFSEVQKVKRKSESESENCSGTGGSDENPYPGGFHPKKKRMSYGTKDSEMGTTPEANVDIDSTATHYEKMKLYNALLESEAEESDRGIDAMSLRVPLEDEPMGEVVCSPRGILEPEARIPPLNGSESMKGIEGIESNDVAESSTAIPEKQRLEELKALLTKPVSIPVSEMASWCRDSRDAKAALIRSFADGSAFPPRAPGASHPPTYTARFGPDFPPKGLSLADGAEVLILCHVEFEDMLADLKLPEKVLGGRDIVLDWRALGGSKRVGGAVRAKPQEWKPEKQQDSPKGPSTLPKQKARKPGQQQPDDVPCPLCADYFSQSAIEVMRFIFVVAVVVKDFVTDIQNKFLSNNFVCGRPCISMYGKVKLGRGSARISRAFLELLKIITEIRLFSIFDVAMSCSIVVIFHSQSEL
ncbi:unnamed protein product [Notodromas monacha]|uniref:Histone-lysine N-methyltransferase, H3 lysine-79 specific n=1 Tax=Notodromas monacha TaxID=399045 RepID=A0A7R9BP37_9CRUS|nr:unnamed protein product [Notodromas monacha]CAG0917717.1 unnamed protein product [Notodromas monacha]